MPVFCPLVVICCLLVGIESHILVYLVVQSSVIDTTRLRFSEFAVTDQSRLVSTTDFFCFVRFRGLAKGRSFCKRVVLDIHQGKSQKDQGYTFSRCEPAQKPFTGVPRTPKKTRECFLSELLGTKETKTPRKRSPREGRAFVKGCFLALLGTQKRQKAG